MYIVWLCLAVFCLVYYIICASYAGIGSSFIFIWLMGAVFFAILFEVKVLEHNGIISVNRIIKMAVSAIIIIGLVLFIFIEILIVSGMAEKPQKDCRYLIVLGCQVRGNEVTKSLRYRLDKAYEYAEENKDVMIIVSGGQGKGENVSEAEAMKLYLVKKGIDENRIIMEDKSTDTSENIRYSFAIIGEDNKDVPVAIVTNNFHIKRSVLLAKHIGLSNVSGLPASTDKILFLNYMVREAIGMVKDFVYGNIL